MTKSQMEMIERINEQLAYITGNGVIKEYRVVTEYIEILGHVKVTIVFTTKYDTTYNNYMIGKRGKITDQNYPTAPSREVFGYIEEYFKPYQETHERAI